MSMRLGVLCALLALLACVLGGTIAATDPIDPVTRQGAALIIARALADGNTTWERLAYMCDTFGPRFSGTPALEAAIDHIVELATSDGLKVTQEAVMIPRWVRGNEWARMVAPGVRQKKLAITGLGMSIGTPNNASVRADVLVVSSFADLAAKASQAAGKIVVYNQPWVSYGETVDYRYAGAQAAAKAGAIAALVHSVAPWGIQTPHTGSSATASIPSAAITREDALLMQRMQDRGQRIVVELYMEAHFLPDVQSRNVLIEIEGSELPDEFVTVGGHIDSWDVADGAMDDGGGAMASFEAVRLMHILGLRPRRTVRAIFYVNEENGARGGAQYALDHAAELARTSLAIESDGGTFTPFGISVVGTPAATDLLRTIGAELLADLGSGNVTSTTGGDTDVSFVCARGVPCGALLDLDPRIGDAANNPCRSFSHAPYPPPPASIPEGYFFYHHTAADTPDKLDPHQLQLSAASLSVWVWTVANLPDLLPR